MLHRKIEKEIARWIDGDNRALLLYGVRQAGKTFVIRKCLKNAGCDYVEFNLVNEPEVVNLLSNATNTDDLILKLSLYSSKRIEAGVTYIFFDEIQKYKEIVTKIKFLVEDNRYRYIMSGSLLGVEITNLKSAPAGYLKSLVMYPLDFEEFVQIFNVPDEVITSIKSAYKEKKPVDDMIHKKMMELFNLYLIIGGMPAAVEKYRRQNSIDEVIDEHLEIARQYQLDFTQYEAENRKLILSNIYELMPAELNEQNKRFKIADIDKNLRYDRVSDSFVWLWKAGVALPAFNISQPLLPLMLNQRRSLFKLFFSDVGMLTSLYGKGTKLKIINGDTDVNKGAVYENVVAQELTAHGYELYYYNSKKTGELDFVIEDRGQVLPIEVKSGKNYQKHSALVNVLGEKNYNIERGLVFSGNNVSRKDNIIYLPLYMIMCLEKDSFEFEDISIKKFMWHDNLKQD